MSSKVEGKDRLLRVDQAATRLNISKRQVYVLVRDGAFYAIDRPIRILESSLEEYISDQILDFDRKNGWAN